MSAKKYVALWDFTHNDQSYKMGDELTMSEDEARSLREKRLILHVSNTKRVESLRKTEAKAPVKEKK
jgi:hypothetical protein